MAVVGSVLVAAFAGVALAAIKCTGGLCEGTNGNDAFVGTNRVALIIAKDSCENVEVREGSP